MQSSFRSRTFSILAITSTVAFATIVTGQDASDRARRGVRRYQCSVRAGVPSPPETTTKRRRRQRRWQRRFSAQKVLDIELRTAVRSSPDDVRRIRLELYTPKGHLYQELSARLPVQESDNETSSHGRRRIRVAKATLPVAGTTIVTSSLYGKWKVRAYFDGSREPCSPPQHFVIMP